MWALRLILLGPGCLGPIRPKSFGQNDQNVLRLRHILMFSALLLYPEKSEYVCDVQVFHISAITFAPGI